jgi:hypothetical protein
MTHLTAVRWLARSGCVLILILGSSCALLTEDKSSSSQKVGGGSAGSLGLKVSARSLFHQSQLTSSPSETSFARLKEHYAVEEAQLPNGKVLYVGGLIRGKSVSLYDPVSETLTHLTETQGVFKEHFTVTPLSSGKVLIVGGSAGTVELYDPSGTGSSVLLTSLPDSRFLHTATLLANGKVLITGGQIPITYAITDSVILYDLAGSGGVGSYTTLTSLSVGRMGHSATLLSNGKVLILGGGSNNVELYDPSGIGSRVTLSATLPVNHTYHSATLLSDGRVLLIGGPFAGTAVTLYDPSANSGNGGVTSLNPLPYSKEYHTAILLPGNKVFVLAGQSTNTTFARTPFIYDPYLSGGTLTQLTPLPTSGGMPSAVRLGSGEVLCATGNSYMPYLYNPTGSGSFRLPGANDLGTEQAASVTLPNGKVLILGGRDVLGDPIKLVKLFDPATKSISSLAPLAAGRSNHTATLLPSGKVLVMGGYDADWNIVSQVELYDPSGSGSTQVLTSAHLARANHTAVLLSNGKVLLVGGEDSNGDIVKSVELYNPSGSGSSTQLTDLSTAHGYHTANLLSNGKVLIIGGYDANWDPTAQVELYDPNGSGTSTPLNPLPQPRGEHLATTLPSGKILVLGGYDLNWDPTKSVILYDPSGNGMATSLADLSTERVDGFSALLSDSKVLVGGGYNIDYDFLDSIEIYNPEGLGSTAVYPRTLIDPRTYPVWNTLPDGSIFIYGGCGNLGANYTFDIFSTSYDKAKLAPFGGTAPYQYSLSNGIGGISADGYFVPSKTGKAEIKVTDSSGQSAIVPIEIN